MLIDINKLAALAEILGGGASPDLAKRTDHPAAHLIGQFVIIRSRDSGVHAGTLTNIQDRVATLSGSRRLWWWKASRGHTLSGVALHGIDASGSKIAGELTQIVVLDVCEIIPTTEAAATSIMGAPEYDPA